MLTILTGPDRQAGLSQLIDTICARAAEGIGEQILIVPEQYSSDNAIGVSILVAREDQPLCRGLELYEACQPRVFDLRRRERGVSR